MKEYYYAGDFAGVRFCFAFRHPDTFKYFHGWLTSSEPEGESIRVPASDCECWIRDYGMQDDGNTEFGMSAYRASDALLRYDRCVIHAAALLWRGKAWLFAADSGVGKSTQLRLWKELYGDEVRILNGDKPILCRESDGTLRVYPSPWKGKEEWGNDALSAPLGGMILLKQGRENVISRSVPVEMAARLLSFFFSSFEEEETIRALCRMETAILHSVPVWKLVNLGDAASARLTHDTLLREEELHV